jgi:hypothetical protein
LIQFLLNHQMRADASEPVPSKFGGVVAGHHVCQCNQCNQRNFASHFVQKQHQSSIINHQSSFSGFGALPKI